VFFKKSSAKKQESGTQPPASACSASDTEKPMPCCTFCKKNQREVAKLICGPSVVICDECVDLCNHTLFEEQTKGGEIKYNVLTQAALRNVARLVLSKASYGLPGAHHFYVTFDTTASGVSIPTFLKEQYPNELTIVLQHQIFELKVNSYCFQVQLVFGGQPARITVPFHAIRAFYDPSVGFSFKFDDLQAKAPLLTIMPANEQRSDTPLVTQQTTAPPNEASQSIKEPILNFNPRLPEMAPWPLEKDALPEKPRKPSPPIPAGDGEPHT
jgi:uncharacterized protein